MNKKKYVKHFYNSEFFDLPDNFFKVKATALKFRYIKNKIELVHPCLFICNKTTPFDMRLISNTLKGTYVFLKDSVVQKIYDNKLSQEKRKELLKSFATLKEAFISVVMFPEKNMTVFGKPEILPESITNFIKETEFNIKFFSLVGTYFSYPVWSTIFKPCETRFHQQFNLSYNEIDNLSPAETNSAINSYMPSSATTYSHKYNPFIRSNQKAQNLETVIYCCPNCKNLFSVYSEYNCLKCMECGTAVEFASNGTILLSSNITDLESFADFQFNVLNTMKYNDKKPMISYPAISCWIKNDAQEDIYFGFAKLNIYCNKIVLNTLNGDLEYKLNKAQSVEYKRNNTLVINMNNKEKITLSGSNKQNFYIIHDLVKIING